MIRRVWPRGCGACSSRRDGTHGPLPSPAPPHPPTPTLCPRQAVLSVPAWVCPAAVRLANRTCPLRKQTRSAGKRESNPAQTRRPLSGSGVPVPLRWPAPGPGPRALVTLAPCWVGTPVAAACWAGCLTSASKALPV